MRGHLHRGPWTETLRSGTWAVAETDTARAHVRSGRVTERQRICRHCGTLTVITTRNGASWRRHTPAVPFDPTAPNWPAETPGAGE